MERRMAALFLLALALILWQAMRIKPAMQPAFEIATKGGEQIAPMAVPSWRPPPNLREDLPERFSHLMERSVRWPAAGTQAVGNPECDVFVRLSAHHWVRRPASPTQIGRWLGTGERSGEQWRLLRFPVASFLEDDDGDGDPLDDGELRQAAPGAEVEVFCGDFR
jgi:hypothetical protein